MSTKVDKGAIANAWLSNKAVVYVLVAIAGGLALRFLVPSIFDGAKKGFSKVVDDIRGGIASIIGSPESQEPSKRTTTDTIKGVFTEDDRALSDIYDNTLGRIFN